MPEGDTIHKIALAFRRWLVGQRLERVWVRSEEVPDLGGRQVLGVRAHGKHLFIHLAGEVVLRSHLGLSGSWHRYHITSQRPFAAHQIWLQLRTPTHDYLCVNAQEVERMPNRGFRHRELLAHLGEDLAAPHPNLDRVLTRLCALPSGTPAVDVLLSQRLGAGIGNVYASELLFLCGVAPTTPQAALTRDAWRGIFVEANRLLQHNVAPGPRVTRPGAGGHLWVYGREGRPCYRCQSTIRRARLGKHLRSTYWCATCQPAVADASEVPRQPPQAR